MGFSEQDFHASDKTASGKEGNQGRESGKGIKASEGSSEEEKEGSDTE